VPADVPAVGQPVEATAGDDRFVEVAAQPDGTQMHTFVEVGQAGGLPGVVAGGGGGQASMHERVCTLPLVGEPAIEHVDLLLREPAFALPGAALAAGAPEVRHGQVEQRVGVGNQLDLADEGALP
jgi:hypothetical protein